MHSPLFSPPPSCNSALSLISNYPFNTTQDTAAIQSFAPTSETLASLSFANHVSHLVLFCFVLFCFVLFCFVLFCFVLFYFILFYFIFMYTFIDIFYLTFDILMVTFFGLSLDYAKRRCVAFNYVSRRICRPNYSLHRQLYTHWQLAEWWRSHIDYFW